MKAQAIHVSIVSTGSGTILVAAVASLLCLLRRRHELPDGGVESSTLGHRLGLAQRLATALPPDDVLDRVACGTAIIAFPLFTTGVNSGAIWAEAAWDRPWGWDPKVAVWFIAMFFNLSFINYVVAGLHSYAG